MEGGSTSASALLTGKVPSWGNRKRPAPDASATLSKAARGPKPPQYPPPEELHVEDAIEILRDTHNAHKEQKTEIINVMKDAILSQLRLTGAAIDRVNQSRSDRMGMQLGGRGLDKGAELRVVEQLEEEGVVAPREITASRDRQLIIEAHWEAMETFLEAFAPPAR